MIKKIFAFLAVVSATANTDALTTLKESQYLNTSGTAWSTPPRPLLTAEDKTRFLNPSVQVKIYANGQGKITETTILKSSGNTLLDMEIIRSIHASRFKPYTENGIATPFYVIQPFILWNGDNLNTKHCVFSFNSRVWAQQQRGQKTPFKYMQQPKLSLFSQYTMGESLTIKFEFTVNKRGKPQHISFIENTAHPEINDAIKYALIHSKIESLQPINTQQVFKDEISFLPKECKYHKVKIMLNPAS